jgi:glycosyltransferase involved in cell wall biosynthesis
MQGIVARRIDRVITSSFIGKEELKSTFRIKDDRIRIIYSGTDTQVFKNIEGDWTKRKGILFVGNAQDPKKGISTLLEALTRLSRDVILTIVDDGEPAKHYAPGLVKNMGLSDRVKFTGKVSMEELIKHYCNARIVVIPSLFEGFGLPAVEAMACGTPVVATEVGALPEVIGKDGAGILVPPKDPSAMERAIVSLLSDEKKCKEMGMKGRKRVEEMFSWRKTAIETVNVYREVIVSKGH